LVPFQFGPSRSLPKENKVNIYVGNLSFDVREEDLQQLFQPFGTVSTVTIIKDKFTGQHRGFGFVEMAVDAEAQAAITGLNGKDVHGRALSVNEARPRAEGGGGGGRRPGGGGRSGGGGFGRGGGGGRGGRGGGGGGRQSW
jgi:RNA recognition motif-containing protein